MFDNIKLSHKCLETEHDMGKRYVEVTVVFSEEGNVRPLDIRWEDGRHFEIDRVLNVQRASSLRTGGCGMRYTCMINGQRSYLYYENDGRWFVDLK